MLAPYFSFIFWEMEVLQFHLRNTHRATAHLVRCHQLQTAVKQHVTAGSTTFWIMIAVESELV